MAQGDMISAVIPTKNRPVDLQNAILSVVAQSRPPEELLVIIRTPETDGAWKRQGTTVDNLTKELRLALQYPEGAAG